MSPSSSFFESDSSPASPASKDIISQSDVERLLAQVETVDPSTPAADAVAPANTAGHDIIRRHDFPKLSLFSPVELRLLRVRHEEFISALAARLSIHLGLQASEKATEPFQFLSVRGRPSAAPS